MPKRKCNFSGKKCLINRCINNALFCVSDVYLNFFLLNSNKYLLIIFINPPIQMDKFLQQKREHDDSGSNKHNENSSKKRIKARSIRKYNEGYLAFGFHWTGNIDGPLPLCVLC